MPRVAMLSVAERIVGRSAVMCARLGMLLACLLVAVAVAPQSAQAHGAVDPVASSYLARIKSVPAGMRARVVDGDLRLWLEVPRGKTVVVLDYQGAAYLRFRGGRIWANENSAMYYYNQTPPITPPLGLKKDAPEHWVQVGSGDSYQWHDGRLHAFALEALPAGSSYAGPWRIPILVDGHLQAVSGTLWYRGDPSIVWLWPIAILILCVVAAWRLRDPRLDARIARAVAGFTLFGILLAAVGRGLHGRPGISVIGVVGLTIITVPAAWTGWRVLRNRAGSFTFFLISVVGLWEAITLIPTLFHGYVLLAVPPFLGRAATVICAGGAIALLLPTVRLFREEQGEGSSELLADDAADEAADEAADQAARFAT